MEHAFHIAALLSFETKMAKAFELYMSFASISIQVICVCGMGNDIKLKANKFSCFLPQRAHSTWMGKNKK